MVKNNAWRKVITIEDLVQPYHLKRTLTSQIIASKGILSLFPPYAKGVIKGGQMYWTTWLSNMVIVNWLLIDDGTFDLIISF